MKAGIKLMSNVVFFNSYKLKKDVSVADFLIVVENLNNEYISKFKGYISFKVAIDGETWADSTTFETMDDAKNCAEACDPNEWVEKFCSFLEPESCTSHFFVIEKSFTK